MLVHCAWEAPDASSLVLVLVLVLCHPPQVKGTLSKEVMNFLGARSNNNNSKI